VNVVEKPSTAPAAKRPAGVVRFAATLWDHVFGPPRVSELPDGSVTVRLLGRRFDASSREALFDAVARERGRLMEQVTKMHEGAAMRPLLGGTRFADGYHRDTQRVQDRVGVYTDFLARLARELGLDGAA
jgi:hypothetical protein